MQKNEVIVLEITAISSDGNGVGRAEGMAVFVPFSAVGDVLEVKLVKLCKSYAFGVLQRVLTPAPCRVPPVCPIYGKCGGCSFQHMDYEAELAAKQQFVTDAMRRLGGLEVPMAPILPAPQPQRYRNKVQYPLTKAADGSVQAGFFAQRSHRVIPCADCVLQPVLLNEIAAEACRLFTRFGVSVYDEAAHKGLLRHLYLRHAVTTDAVMVCFVLNGRTLPHAEEICDALCAAYPQICTVVLNVNTQKTNVITGEECLVLCGDGVLHDEMSGVPVQLGPLSFYQVNTAGANVLYAAAAHLAQLRPHETLLDLYCGAGTIGLSMAHLCQRLIGVEIVPEAIENARRNAAKMNVRHAEFLCADAGAAAQKLAAEGLAPDVVILDPPRKGCAPEALNAVVQMHPQRIVMISCNPATAARDAKHLCAQGYTAQAVQPVDLFARTRHVECVCLMTRTGK